MKSIKKVLMCRPLHYSVDYVINPWMKPGTVNIRKAQNQWEHLVQIYKQAGIEIEIIDQILNLPDMVFAADQGIVIDKKILLSNFSRPERQGERIPYQQWFVEHGYEIIQIRQKDYFEGGGECLPWRDLYFIGTGFRSIKNSVHWISERLDREVVQLELINEYFYHLDTCLFPLNNDTVFYYPEAFSKTSIEILKSRIPHLIKFSEEEANSFCANSIVTGQLVIMQKTPYSFKDSLKQLGYEYIELEMSEFNKSGGGIHCLTNILVYTS